MISGLGAPPPPARAQGLQALDEADARLERLRGRGLVARPERVDKPQLQGVHVERVRERVHEPLVDERDLRHPEAAEGAGRRPVGQDGPGPRVDGRQEIRTRGVHGHAVGDRRPPGRIGAGVEIPAQHEPAQLAVPRGPEARGYVRRMPLGGRGHGFGPGVNATHRPVQQPGGDREDGLHRDVELAAEATTAGARQHADALGREAHNLGHLVPVHIGRLGAGLDLDALAEPAGITGLGLDVGVLHERGLPGALDHQVRVRESRLGVALAHATARQHVAGASLVELWRAGGQGGVHVGYGRQGRPVDGDVPIGDALDRRPLADQRRHGLAPIAHVILGEYRLILDLGIDPEAVVARHVSPGQNAHQAGMAPMQLRHVPEPEAGVGVRRADDPEPKGVGGRPVRGVDLGPVELLHAVHLRQPRADGRTRRRVRLRRGAASVGGREHGLYDLAVAGAAAEDAGQRVRNLGFAQPAAI